MQYVPVCLSVCLSCLSVCLSVCLSSVYNNNASISNEIRRHPPIPKARGAEAARYKALLGTSQAEGEQLRTAMQLSEGALEEAERRLAAADERCASLAGQGA